MAHVLFGGIIMLAAMLIFMLFLGRSIRILGVVLAGVGFGLFIDEVGKFLTGDNDYLFKPVAAIIYVLLIVVYLSVLLIVRRRPLSDNEQVVSALKRMQEAAADHLDPSEADDGRQLLERAATTHPMRDWLMPVFEGLSPRPESLSRVGVGYSAVRRFIIRMPGSRAMQKVGIALVLGFLATSLGAAVLELAGEASAANAIYVLPPFFRLVVALPGFVLLVARRRIVASRLFSLAMAVNLLVVQFFHRLDQTFVGLAGVLVALFLYVLARSMLYRAEHTAQLASVAPTTPL